MHEDAKAQPVGTATTESLQPLHDVFLQIDQLYSQFVADHSKGAVQGDVNAARRRARVVSSEISKLLKSYRMLSNEYGKQ